MTGSEWTRSPELVGALFWSVPGLVKGVGVRRCEVEMGKDKDGLEGKWRQGEGGGLAVSWFDG